MTNDGGVKLDKRAGLTVFTVNFPKMTNSDRSCWPLAQRQLSRFPMTRLLMTSFGGVGIRLRSPDLFNKSKWSGKNVMGNALMKVREKLTPK